MGALRIGTCSWKYDSWKGIVYSAKPKINYLEEYSARFNTVEIDQWFWSLFDDIVRLPEEATVKEYNNSVPDNFRFTIKVPNSITLTHYYPSKKKPALKQNSYFLNPDLFNQFLRTLEPIADKVGVLMFQFEYLNRQKMGSQAELIDMLGAFFETVDHSFPYAVEIRNPNYLNKSYFDFLNKINIAHVLLQGYFLPPIKEVFDKYREQFGTPVVVRLHGPDRKMIEEITGGDWSKIVLPKDEKISWLPSIINFFSEREVDVYVNVNNHFEGSAPLTIEKIKRLLD
jgi:uncharacterized protein YecE (DUF72 family)